MSDDDDINDKLATFASLGLLDEARNREALEKFHNDLDDAVSFLLEKGDQQQPQFQLQSPAGPSGARGSGAASCSSVSGNNDNGKIAGTTAMSMTTVNGANQKDENNQLQRTESFVSGSVEPVEGWVQLPWACWDGNNTISQPSSSSAAMFSQAPPATQARKSENVAETRTHPLDAIIKTGPVPYNFGTSSSTDNVDIGSSKGSKKHKKASRKHKRRLKETTSSVPGPTNPPTSTSGLPAVPNFNWTFPSPYNHITTTITSALMPIFEAAASASPSSANPVIASSSGQAVPTSTSSTNPHPPFIPKLKASRKHNRPGPKSKKEFLQKLTHVPMSTPTPPQLSFAGLLGGKSNVAPTSSFVPTAVPRKRSLPLPGSPNSPIAPPTKDPRLPGTPKAHRKSHGASALPSPPTLNSNGTPHPPPPVDATPCQPPSWDDHLQETIMSLQTHKTFPVNPSTPEFQTISELLSPIQVISVDHVVNPQLWQRYTSTRKEMIRSKSDDLALLSKLGFDDREIQQLAHLSQNFVKDPLLTTGAGRYSPNEVLLFHCTRKKEYLDKILNQGLDERLSSTKGGRFGKGIYFADDPIKSMHYDGSGNILIFAVLLGDCLPVHDLPNKKPPTLVREPEKGPSQKRNSNDQFFDSITGRPKGMFNEYVIYNRYQCCPLYSIKYKFQPRTFSNTDKYTSARKYMPTVAWRMVPGGKISMPNQIPDGNWPFYAASVFGKMGSRAGIAPAIPQNVNQTQQPSTSSAPLVQKNVNEVARAAAVSSTSHSNMESVANGNNGDVIENKLIGNGNGSGNVTTVAPSTSSTSTLSNNDTKLRENAAMLISLGFVDQITNILALKKFKNNLDRAVNYLLDNSSPPQSQAQSSTSSADAIAASYPILQVANGGTTPDPVDKSSTSAPDIELIDLDDDLGDANHGNGGAVGRIEKMEVEASTSRPVMPTPAPATEDCPICCNEYASFNTSPDLWKELNCKHRLCLACHRNIVTDARTMSDIPHTSVKCPFCAEITGTIVGNCPNGKMSTKLIPGGCDGHSASQSYEIRYRVKSGRHNLKRKAYLPYNKEGYQVLQLLKIAWDRRLVFTIGTSNTTGAQNVLVWNIHHKTKQSGGVQVHGYPDPGYLDRVKGELKACGIE